MKHPYRWARPLLATLLLFIGLDAGAQAWRPFRPGLIYSYNLRNSTDVTHTLRVDSVYRTTAGDSVYAFNRLMRRYVNAGIASGMYTKSRNNLFGARISWTPGSGFYTFESDAQSGVQGGSSLRIYPRAAVGQTWVASTVPMLTAILRVRSQLDILPGVQDSVATVELRSGTATTGAPLITFVLSRSYGLIEAAPWLGNAVAGTPASAPLVAALPTPLLQSSYSPLALFAMQPGDEMGYHYDPFYFGPAQCQDSYTLRRILTRQQRIDSLVITYQEQTRGRTYGYPFCGGISAGTTISNIRTGRLAFSLRTGRSPQYPALQLLTGEYTMSTLSLYGALDMGLGVINSSSNSCAGSGVQVQSQRLYLNNSTTTYSPGLDNLAWGQTFGAMPGMGDVRTGETGLVYYRRSVGTPLVCGTFFDFTGLLPTRAAQAATLATLHPNPAAESATLTLAAPARPGSTLRLTDALGRFVWSNTVPVGQTAIAVPLAGQPAGLYLLYLSGPEGTSATWKLSHE